MSASAWPFLQWKWCVVYVYISLSTQEVRYAASVQNTCSSSIGRCNLSLRASHVVSPFIIIIIIISLFPKSWIFFSAQVLRSHPFSFFFFSLSSRERSFKFSRGIPKLIQNYEEKIKWFPPSKRQIFLHEKKSNWTQECNIQGSMFSVHVQSRCSSGIACSRFYTTHTLISMQHLA